MSRLLVTAAALAGVAGVGAAGAADLPVRAPAPAPVLAPATYDWTGFYLGVDAGDSHAHQSATTTPFPSPGFGAPAIAGGGIAGFGNLPTSHNLNGNGLTAGVYGGYNWHAAPNFVFGVEGDVNWLNRSSSDTETVFATFSPPPPRPAFNMTYSANDRWLASARGRIGWVGGPFMLYATGGAAFASTSYTATAVGLVSPPVTLPGVLRSTSLTDDRIGWAAGAGAEWMVASNWVLRAEYLHYGFGGSSGNLPLVLTSGVANANCTPGRCNWALNSSRLDFDTARVGLSYKFGGPVVARY